MNKRQTKLFDLRWDVAEAKILLYSINTSSVLADALWIACEKTTFAEDAREIINVCCPTYFETEDTEES